MEGIRGIRLWKSSLAVVALLCAPLLPAATITVTSGLDTADPGHCRLRDAIVNANGDNQSGSTDCDAGSGADVIVFDSGLDGSTITLAGALPSITSNLAIDGSEASGLTISGNDLYRVFFVGNGGTVTISNLTIAHGHARGGNGGSPVCGGGGGGGAGFGGGLFINVGSVTARSVVFDSNTVAGGSGGASTDGICSLFAGGGGGIDGNAGDNGSNGDGGNGGVLGGTGGTGGAPGTDGTPDGAGGGGGRGGRNPVAPGGNGSFGGGGGGGNNGGGGGAGGAFAGDGSSAQSGADGGSGAGGAIFVRDGSTLFLVGSTFLNNSAARGAGGPSEFSPSEGSNGTDGPGKGGAIYVMPGATASQCNTTYSGNTASDAGTTATDNADVFGTIVSTTPIVSPTTLSDVSAGSPVSASFSASPSGTYTFSATGLPSWLTLAPDGTLSGTPLCSNAGPVSFTVIATEASGCTGSQPIAFTVTAPTISISPTTLPAALVGHPFSATFTASPAGTYTFSAIGLPGWLTLAPDGTLTGTPTSSDIGTASFTIVATDTSSQCVGRQVVELQVVQVAQVPTLGGAGLSALFLGVVLAGWALLRRPMA
jgi:hypothetical protein